MAIPTDAWRFPVTGGLVLAVPGVDGLYLLNSSAAFIWDQLIAGISADCIGSNLADAFQIPRDVAVKDVHAALEAWTQESGVRDSTENLPPLAPSSGPREASIRCQWDGRNFDIAVDSPELAAEIEPRLSAFIRPEGEAEFRFDVTTVGDLIYLRCGAEFIAAEASAPAARAILLQEIARRIGSTDKGPRQWLCLLHAGACGNDRACVVFPAASHSGKTTLAAYLMHKGMTFYGDDSVAIEKETLRIAAMPFGLSIREGSWALLEEIVPGFDQLPICERYGQRVRYLNPRVHQAAVPARAIVFSQYVPDADLSIHPLNTIEALLRLQQGGFWVDHEPASIRAFLEWVESLPCYAMTYSDIEPAGQFISQLLG